MTFPWEVRLKVGTKTWTIHDGDAPIDFDQPLAGLTVSRTTPDSGIWPEQPDPATLQVQLRIVNASFMPGIVLGAPVSFLFIAGGKCLERFDGRISDLVLRPRSNGVAALSNAHPYGALLDVTAVEYVADWAEQQVGAVDWPAEPSFARLNRIAAEAGMTITTPADPDTHNPNVRARSASGTDALSLIASHLRQWKVDTTSHGGGRYVLVPTLSYDASGFGTLTGWTLALSSPDVQDRDAPARFGVMPDAAVGAPATYGVIVNAADAFTIDAGLVGNDVAWTRRKRLNPNRVQVKSDSFGIITRKRTAPKDEGTITVAIDTDLDTAADGARLADFYLPRSTGDGWAADGMTWLAYADDPLSWPIIFGSDVLPGSSVLGAVVGVSDVLSYANPTQVPWYVGQVAAYSLEIAERARPRLRFSWRPPVMNLKDSTTYALTFDRIGTTWPTVTFDQIDSRIRFDQLSYVRKV